MAYRYEADLLLYLRESPLCVRPAALPPAEELMGPPPDQAQGRAPAKTAHDRTKVGDGLLGPDTRRTPLDRPSARSAPNPEDIILGPPRNSFGITSSSLRNGRPGEADKGPRDGDRQVRSDRLSFRNRAGESDGTGDRRDGRNSSFRRRGDQDEGEGWSTVKPRKSFGHDGAERFHGRMGGGGGVGDRYGGRDDRRTRDDRETTRDTGDRRNRNLDRAADRDGDDTEGARRNGPGRGRSDPWFRDNNSSNPNQSDAPVSQRERIDRAKSWRDRDHDDSRAADRYGERGNDRPHDRRWDRDRDQRQERDPAWLDEPVEEQGQADAADESKRQAHTADDLRKWMEAQKQRASKSDKSEEKPAAAEPLPEAEPPREAETPRTTEPAPEPELSRVPAGPTGGAEPRRDKFFAAYEARGINADSPAGNNDATKAKPSRFMGKVISAAPQEDARLRTEPTTPAAGIPSGNGTESPGGAGSNAAEKEAFQALLQKLQRSGMGSQGSSNANTPAAAVALSQPPFQPQPQPAAGFPGLPPVASDVQHKPRAMVSPEPFQHYGGADRRMEEARMRTPQSTLQSILSPHPMGPSAPPSALMRQEQALQDLLAQRHQAPSQTSSRMAQNAAAVNNNTAFLMQLMQSHREVPEPQQRIDPQQLMMRMPQPTKQQSQSVANIMERAEHSQPDFSRDVRSLSQPRQMRTQPGPPGFLDDQQPLPPQFHHGPDMMDSRGPPQPTQILPRPPIPGMEHHIPFPIGGNGNMAGGGGGAQLGGPPQHQQQHQHHQQQHQHHQQQHQQRPMIPPPGLVNAPPQSRNNMPPPPPPNIPSNMPSMPPNMQAVFANFPPGAFPPGPGVPQGPPPPGPPPPHEALMGNGGVGGMRGIQPPPGFFAGPPPGFMAPPPGMNGFQGSGPDGPGFGAGPPFVDRRGMMPPGTFRGM